MSKHDYEVDPATPGVDSAGIFQDGKLLLATAIDSWDPEDHNRLAEWVAEALREKEARSS